MKLVPPRDLDLMKQLYDQLMAPRYRETRDTHTWEEATLTGNGTQFDKRLIECPDASDKSYVKHGAPERQFDLWPASDKNDEFLWSEIAANGQLSLLLGAPQVEYIRDTPFDVLSSIDASKFSAIDRQERTTAKSTNHEDTALRRGSNEHTEFCG